MVGVIGLLLHQRRTCRIAAAVFGVTGGVLHVTWYRALQTRADAAAQVRERVEC